MTYSSRAAGSPASMAIATRHLRLFLAAAVLAALTLAAPASAALTAPVLLDPGPGASVEALPAFSWTPVAGADWYEFQVAADQNFNSPVLGRGEGSFATRNTRATLKKTLPNGRYWWRVRATTKSGDASPWSTPRSLSKAWTGAELPHARLRLPVHVPHLADLARLGAGPLRGELHVLARQRSRAREHRHQQRAAARDVGDELRARAFNLLPSGTYYWNVDPGRLGGQPREPSPVSLLQLVLALDDDPGGNRPDGCRRDVRPAVLLDPVPGATKYEVEVNSSVDFAPGSKVCCSQLDDLDLARADGRVPRQHVLLARPRARRCRQRRCLEPRARLHQDVRQGAAGDPAEHQEPPHARQPGRPGHRRGSRYRRATRRTSRSSSGTRFPGLPRYLVDVASLQRRHLRLGRRAGASRHRCRRGRRSGRAGTTSSRIRMRCPLPMTWPRSAEPAVLRARSRERRARRRRTRTSTETSRTSMTAAAGPRSSGRDTRPAAPARRPATRATWARTTTCFPRAARSLG